MIKKLRNQPYAPKVGARGSKKKLLGSEANPLPSSSAEVQNAWNYTTISNTFLLRDF
jgi:hypothetical protein